MTFRRPPPKPAKQLGDGYTLRPRAIAEAVAGPARMSVPVPKQQPVRHEGYRRLVSSLPCLLCKREGQSQAAHENEGKGMAQKTDDRRCFHFAAQALALPGVTRHMTRGPAGISATAGYGASVGAKQPGTRSTAWACGPQICRSGKGMSLEA